MPILIRVAKEATNEYDVTSFLSFIECCLDHGLNFSLVIHLYFKASLLIVSYFKRFVYAYWQIVSGR
ncbi:MAG: hypothetical protein AOA65_2176 [Candidatus Bathyarchaeota archaeon BA1]|nr:MAG: hypothetical protein AOA65_2176 [Candidatus Bathyarchaeota archaeon BA1]